MGVLVGKGGVGLGPAGGTGFEPLSRAFASGGEQLPDHR